MPGVAGVGRRPVAYHRVLRDCADPRGIGTGGKPAQLRGLS